MSKYPVDNPRYLKHMNQLPISNPRYINPWALPKVAVGEDHLGLFVYHPTLQCPCLRRRVFDHDRGVYFLFDSDDLVYVGATEDIQKRLSVHFHQRNKQFDSISIMSVENMSPWLASNLQYAEAYFILRYCPRYNEICHSSTSYLPICPNDQIWKDYGNGFARRLSLVARWGQRMAEKVTI